MSEMVSNNAYKAFPVLGGAMGAYGSVKQGDSAKMAADLNARTYRQQADNRLKASAWDEELLRYNARYDVGRQAAMSGQATGGITGSSLDLLRESYRNAEHDAAALRTDAAIDVAGLRNQALLTEWEGKQAKRAGVIGAVGSGINAAMYAASMEDEMLNEGRVRKSPSVANSLLKTNRYGRVAPAYRKRKIKQG